MTVSWWVFYPGLQPGRGLCLEPGDVAAGLELYRESRAKGDSSLGPLTAVLLPPALQARKPSLWAALTREAESLGVLWKPGPGGLLSSELWCEVADEDMAVITPPTTAGPGTQFGTHCAEASEGRFIGAKSPGRVGQGREASKPGPKGVVLPVERLLGLEREGLGIKRIAEQLRAEGVKVSARTVARRLADLRPGRGPEEARGGGHS